ncbi:unnamed protein product [Calypogeia fissa]
MGIISRRVLPACGNLCICCPELRARSRQPVKRYKKLLSDIFPTSQEELPNDRKIGKLTEYASKNPLRIPKIATSLEQRGYKALRNERYSPLRVVMRTYSKLLSSCRDQMPLFATSALSMIRLLLDHVRNDSMRVLACQTLIDFLNNQMDSTYTRDLDALLPKLCAISKETGEEHRSLRLRAAGLQALASVINFLGKYSHMPPEFDDVVAAVLENFEISRPAQEVASQDRTETQCNWVNGMFRGEGRGPVAVMRGAITRLQSRKENSNPRDASNLTRMETETPMVWSQLCIQNLARLAKEATTVRRVLEPMFRYFDKEKLWPPEKLAIRVLRDLQHFMEKSGNEQLSLPALVRHLDHNAVMDNPELKTSIVEVIVQLTRQSKVRATVAFVGIMSDLIRHLRRSMECCVEASKLDRVETLNLHKGLQHALEECLIELAKRVGDAAPLFDMMATTLEKLPTNPIIARTTTEAVFVLAHCVAYVPDQSSAGKVFPEALFQELLQGMVHPDVETRVTIHHIFALLLVPSSLIANSEDLDAPQSEPETLSVLSRSSSAFSSAAALFEKLGKEKCGFAERNMCFDKSRCEITKDNEDGIEMVEMSPARKENGGNINSSSPSPGNGIRVCEEQSWERSTAQVRRPSNGTKDLDLSIVRLSGHQAALLLSRLWIQAILPDNVPSSYEAIANTYILTLLFSRAKTSSHKTVIRAFQLALSLRSLAIDPNYAGVQLPPSRRRSLFTLSTAMLVFAGRAYGVPQLGTVVKASLTNATKDPYLELSDDIRLKIVNSSIGYVNVKDYGSTADDRDAYKSFLGISISEEHTSEALAALIVGSSTVLGPDDFAVADQMLQAFPPEKGFRLGSQSYLEPFYCSESPLELRDSVSFDEGLRTNSSLEDNLRIGSGGIEMPPLLANFCGPPLATHAISVSQLLEAAVVTAGQRLSTSTTDVPLPYSAVANQCEAFSADSRKKISSVLKLGGQYGTLVLTFSEKDYWSSYLKNEKLQHGQFREVVRLPPASPYDNFLKAAGC